MYLYFNMFWSHRFFFLLPIILNWNISWVRTEVGIFIYFKRIKRLNEKYEYIYINTRAIEINCWKYWTIHSSNSGFDISNYIIFRGVEMQASVCLQSIFGPGHLTSPTFPLSLGTLVISTWGFQWPSATTTSLHHSRTTSNSIIHRQPLVLVPIENVIRSPWQRTRAPHSRIDWSTSPWRHHVVISMDSLSPSLFNCTLPAFIYTRKWHTNTPFTFSLLQSFVST